MNICIQYQLKITRLFMHRSALLLRISAASVHLAGISAASVHFCLAVKYLIMLFKQKNTGIIDMSLVTLSLGPMFESW